MTEKSISEYVQLMQIMTKLIGVQPDVNDAESCTKIVANFLLHKRRLDEVSCAFTRYVRSPSQTQSKQSETVLSLAENFVRVYENAHRTYANLRARADMATGRENYRPSSYRYS